MTDRRILALLLSGALAAGAAQAQQASLPPGVSEIDLPAAGATPAAASPATTATAQGGVRPLPPMQFYSSVGGDTVYDLLKAQPAFAQLDKELVGTPLYVIVTHTVRPTSGGTAAGAFTGLLAGSTLGLIPVVTSDQYVIRYEVWMQGHPVTKYSFTRTKTSASNMWVTDDKNYGLGKGGIEWLKSTALEFAAKAATDPKLAQLQAEIDYYFPVVPTAATPAAAGTSAAAPASVVPPPPAPPTKAGAAPARRAP